VPVFKGLKWSGLNGGGEGGDGGEGGKAAVAKSSRMSTRCTTSTAKSAKWLQLQSRVALLMNRDRGDAMVCVAEM
jgi:hypothetical protein